MERHPDTGILVHFEMKMYHKLMYRFGIINGPQEWRSRSLLAATVTVPLSCWRKAVVHVTVSLQEQALWGRARRNGWPRPGTPWQGIPIPP
jgi:hypothetical protein